MRNLHAHTNNVLVTRRTAIAGLAATAGLAGSSLLTGCGAQQNQKPDSAAQDDVQSARDKLAWWQDTIVYEAYPKSFLDTVGQGKGTIAGVTSKLDYLASLGVGAITASQEATAADGWYCIYFENHDQPRSVSHILPRAKDKPAGAKMLGTLLMTLRGTPFLYEGEELGYANIAWDSIDDYDDVTTYTLYAEALEAGKTEEEALGFAQFYSRDNARTPMQWDASKNAGFTTGKPWLPVHDDYETCNVDVQEQDPESVLPWYLSLRQLREDLPVLKVGDYHELMADSEEVFAYERCYGADKAVILANFTESQVTFDKKLVEGMELATSTHESSVAGTLQPLEAVVYRTA